MAEKKLNTTPPEIVTLYDKLIATIPEIERKGDTNPYTSCNGNMFTHLSPGGILAIRLAPKDIETFIKKYKARLMVSYGIVRKEYVEVPAGLLKKTNELKQYLELSFAYVKTLKAKPSAKTKSK